MSRVPRQDDEIRLRRLLQSLTGTRYGYTLPPETGTGSVAPLRTLTSTSSTGDVRAFIITFVRDLQAEGKVSR